ncbi:MAG: hypothetical protein Q9191_000454 [Dirinaria sp. TL-2023a]
MLSGFAYSALALVIFPLTFALPIFERGMCLTAAQVQAVAPKSSSCDNAPAAGQCRTAAQAAPAILNSFNAFGITSQGEQAAVLGIMAFESGDFKYDTPIVPTPGKGTRNMQSADFNKKYAMSIPGLAPKVAAVANDPDAIRGLLTSNDYYDFGSGAWFLATQCTPAVRSGLATGSLSGWQAYITSCVETTPTSDRQAYWERAVQALK